MFSFRKKIIGKNNKKIIFLLCGWPGKTWNYLLTAKILETKGFQSVIYEYDDTILSSSIKGTIDNTNAIKIDILRHIALFKKNGYEYFSIFGTSYGTIIAFIVANMEKNVAHLIINLTGADLAETVWTWNKGKSGLIKKRIIKQNISLKSLKKKWAKLSPINNINNLRKVNILFYLAEKDEIIPYKLQIKLLSKLKKTHHNIQIYSNSKSNHLFSALLNLLRFNAYVKFLNRP